MLKLKNIRKGFPILARTINGHPLVYFDNASTAQKPYPVIAAMSDFYASRNANIHRGIHTLSYEATEAYEAVRERVQRFINAKSRDEIVFTSGTTESLNTVAFGMKYLLKAGQEILLTEAEHHSNIVPWQIVAAERKMKLKYIPIKSDGRLDLHAYHKLLNKRARVVAITHASNVTGAITPLQKIIPAAHKMGSLVVVDAAQSVAHIPIDVRRLDCDFLAFSGHKAYGPTGVGVLYGKRDLLESLRPFKYGGHMIKRVTKDQTTLANPPEKFEGGTAPLAEVIGLGAALEWLEQTGLKNIITHESSLSRHTLVRLRAIPGLRLHGPDRASARLPIISFTLDGVPAHDIASLLDAQGIAVRSGHHCAQILHEAFGQPATTRASLAVYNTRQEVDQLAKALLYIQNKFHGD